jgi:branched-chain amino acid transport system permease protein
MGKRLLALAPILLAILAAPSVLSRYYVNLLTEVAIYAIFAMTIDILAGYSGRTPLGHGALFGIGAYLAAYTVAVSRGPAWAGVLLGIAAAAAASLIFALLAIRTSGVSFLLLTLAQGMVVWGICVRWTSVTGAENGIRGIARPEWVADPTRFYYLAVAVAALAAILLWRFVTSPFGLTLRGIRESESRMRTLGYNVPLHLTIGFIVSGTFAGVAGTLYAFFNTFVSPTNVALATSVKGLLMAIIGGVGTLFGAFVGAAVVILLENFVSMYTDRWPIVLGSIFVFTMIFAREGILGKARLLLARETPRLTRKGDQS